MEAKSYSFVGTAYSQFAVIPLGEVRFRVKRLVDCAEDGTPDDCVEPTEAQK